MREQERAERPQQKKKKRKATPLRVEVQPAFQAELYAYDLPAIQPLIDERRFDEAGAVLARYEQMRIALEAQRRDEDDDDLLLLS
jgi:hypothetical protein